MEPHNTLADGACGIWQMEDMRIMLTSLSLSLSLSGAWSITSCLSYLAHPQQGSFTETARKH